MTLYELTDDYLRLLDIAEDPDVDPQTFADTLEGIDGALEDKADNYAKVIRQMKVDADGLDSEIKRLQARKKAIEGNSERMKSNLEEAMLATGKTKFKTELFSFGIQKNPPSVMVDEEHPERIPLEYLIPQDPKIDKRRIMEELKAGAELSWARLEQSESLRIR